jgi:uncharacterized delta-60 repeat protein
MLARCVRAAGLNSRLQTRHLSTTLFCAATLVWSSSRIAAAAGGDLDPSFNPGTGANLDVSATALQQDGKIIIGGNFSTYDGIPRKSVARLQADGSLDPSFDPGAGANSTVLATIVQADGKVLIAGGFNAFDGTARNAIARLNANGSLDMTFAPGGANAVIRAVALQANDRIIIGGHFTSYDGIGRNRIARLMTDGALDPSFDPGTGADDTIQTVAVQADGSVLIGGSFTTYGGTARSRIARISQTGALDASFHPGSGADGTIETIAVQLDGKIVIGGAFTSYDGIARNRIARLNTDGSLDVSFGPGAGADGVVESAIVQPGGKIIIGGAFTTCSGVARNRIARLNSDGSLDTTFDPGSGASDRVLALALQPDGRMLVGGTFTTINTSPRNRIARLLPAPGTVSLAAASYRVIEGAGTALVTIKRTGGTDNEVVAKLSLTDLSTSPADYYAHGSVDPTFDPGSGADFLMRTAALQADGRIIVGGRFQYYNGSQKGRIARVMRNGALDPSFASSPGADSHVFDSAVLPDGKILIGGVFTRYNGVTNNRIARLGGDGALDSAFNSGSGADGVIHSLAVAPDGKILIAGNFFNYDGTPRDRIARLNSDGSLDASFVPGLDANDDVTSIRLSGDGKILVGGNFYQFSGTSRNHIARLNHDGSLDTSFDPGAGPNSFVHDIAVQYDGKIVIVGSFTSCNGIAQNNIARLNSDGSLDSTFNIGSGADGVVLNATLQPDGKILIGGGFDSSNGTARPRMARINPDGSLDTTFANGNAVVSQTIVVQPDGRILVAGGFSYNNDYRDGLLRLLGDLFVTWPAGDSTDKIVEIPITDDALSEGSEDLALALAPLRGGAAVGSPASATLTIIDDEAPAISAIADQVVDEDTSTGAVEFSVTDAQTAAHALTVSASSSNSALVSDANIEFGGNGAERTVTVTPAPNQFGSTEITLTVTDADGLTAIETFLVTVTSVNDVPTISDIANQTIPANTSTGALPFSIGDVETAGASLTVSGTSSNTTLVPNGRIVFGGSGAERSVTVAPASGQSGTATITITVADGQGGTATDAFLLTVNPPPPISISDASATEPVSGTASAVFTVSFPNPTSQTVTVAFATMNGSATGGRDYVPANGMLTFNPGETAKTVTVLVNGDSLDEAAETFTVALSNPTNAVISDGQGIGTIANLIPSGLTCLPVNGSVVALYRGENNAFDSHNSHDGTHSGVFVPTNYTAGRVGRAFHFDGTTRVEVPHQPSLSNQHFTHEAWVNFASVSGGVKVIIGKSSSSNDAHNSFVLHYDPASQTLRSYSGNGLAYPQLAVPFTPVVGTWYHLAQTYDGAAQKIYINGALAGTHNLAITIPYDSHPITIGGERYGTTYLYPFHGQIDEVGIYNTALSAAQIQAIYNASSNGKCTTYDEIRLSSAAHNVFESTGELTVAVRRPNPAGAATVEYATAPGSATDGQDYVGASGTLAFGSGDVEKTVTISLKPDSVIEAFESFAFNLSNPSGAALGTPAAATVTLRDPGFVVNRTTSEADLSPGNGTCDTDPAPGEQCTLHAAIQEANANGTTADFIYVRPGVYTYTAAHNSGGGGLGGNALPQITTPMTIQGAGPESTIIERSTAANTPDFRIFYVVGSNAYLTLNGVTVRNGRTATSGGAIVTHEGGDIVVNDCVFSNNSAPAGFGGAIIPVVSAAAITVNNSTFFGNSARDGSGAIGGDFITATNSDFTVNTVTVGGAGAIGSNGTVNVVNCTFTNNGAFTSSGAIGGNSSSTMNIMRSRFTGSMQTAVNSSGGGPNISGGTVNVSDSYIAENTAMGERNGGGISAINVLVIGSTISGNTASVGGGIAAANVTVRNSTISGNRARDSGGGIHVSGGGSRLEVSNSTITLNVADFQGGGIRADWGGPSGGIRNTIIAGNSAPNGPDCFERFGRPVFLSQGYNLIGNNSGANFTAATGDLVGTAANPINPRLGPLQNNGGPTLTHNLLTGSPAIDAANPILPGSSVIASEVVDQRGVLRPIDHNRDGVAVSDIGAVEAAVPPVIAGIEYVRGGPAKVHVRSIAGLTHTLRRNTSLDPNGWTDVTSASGTGEILTLIDPSPTEPRSFYRVEVTY